MRCLRNRLRHENVQGVSRALLPSLCFRGNVMPKEPFERSIPPHKAIAYRNIATFCNSPSLYTSSKCPLLTPGLAPCQQVFPEASLWAASQYLLPAPAFPSSKPREQASPGKCLEEKCWEGLTQV